ncbi:MAG: hypothetical protein N3F07_03940 [Candidatus Micrarchaeota archaeon]|nr:hypothetical protein [Candidatus Micrarchaeota archaeon]
MRRLALVALLLAFASGLFLLTFYLEEKMKASPPSPPAQKSQEAEEGALIIRRAELADHGQGAAALLEVFLKGSAEAFCSPHPPATKAIILQHAKAPGMDLEIEQALEDRLERCGFFVQKAALDEIELESGAILVSAAGAVPKRIAELNKSAQGNAKILALELIAGKLIDENGSMQQGNASPGIIRLDYLPEKRQEAVLGVLRHALAGNQSALSLNESKLVAIPANYSPAYCRVFRLADGSCRFFDSGKISLPKGRLSGPAELIAGRAAAFSFSMGESGEAGRKLSLFAVLQKGGKEVLRKKVFEGEILPGHENRILLEFSSPGEYEAHVEDQFGRIHAKAYAKALGLNAKEVLRQGRKYEYYLEMSGSPVSGHVQARINDGEPKDYYASNGTVVIWASPKGEGNITFTHKGASASIPISGEPESIWISYLRLYAPAAVFLLAIYLLIGAARKEKYTIYFPNVAKEPAKKVCLGQDGIIRSCKLADLRLGGHRLALLPEEIGRAALALAGAKEQSGMDLASLSAILEKLKQKGRLVEFGGYYAPKEFADGFLPKELVALRILHDLMLERGIRFSKKREIDVGKSLQLQVFGGKEGVLRGIGKRRRVVIFATREEMEDFEKSLEEPTEENVKIKIALSNRKLALAHASRESLEGILP